MSKFGSARSFQHVLLHHADKQLRSVTKRDMHEEGKRIWKRDLSLRPNGTIDPWVSYKINIKKIYLIFLIVRLFLARHVFRLCHQLYVSMECVLLSPLSLHFDHEF